MMNEVLYKELSAHFNKINEREEYLNNFKDKLSLRNGDLDSIEEEIKKEVTRKAKEYLDKNNFNYENGRTHTGARIIFENGKLKVRKFKKHGFQEINIISSDEINEFLPKGLIKARGIIIQKLDEIKGVILEFKESIKLKKCIPIQIIHDKKIENKNITKIEINFNIEEEHFYNNRHHYNYYNTRSYKSRDEKFEIKLNDYEYGVDNSLYSDDVFNTILNLIEKFKKHIQKIENTKNKMKEDLKDFVYNQIDKMILIEELRE